MNRRYGNDADAQARLEQERVKSLAAGAIYNARIAAGLTQQQLAERVGTKQPVIARLEDADYDGHTIGMLNRIASALNQRLELRFVPSEAEASITFSGNSQHELITVIGSLVSEIQGLKEAFSSELHTAKTQISDLEANVRKLGEPTKPARSMTDRSWKMDEDRKSSVTNSNDGKQYPRVK